MFLRIVLSFFIFLSVTSTKLNEAKANCNMIDSPKGRSTPSDDPTGKIVIKAMIQQFQGIAAVSNHIAYYLQ